MYAAGSADSSVASISVKVRPGEPYPLGSDGLQRDDRDSAPFMPKSVVIDSAFDRGHDRPPGRKLHETVIYEVRSGS